MKKVKPKTKAKTPAQNLKLFKQVDEDFTLCFADGRDIGFRFAIIMSIMDGPGHAAFVMGFESTLPSKTKRTPEQKALLEVIKGLRS